MLDHHKHGATFLVESGNRNKGKCSDFEYTDHGRLLLLMCCSNHTSCDRNDHSARHDTAYISVQPKTVVDFDRNRFDIYYSLVKIAKILHLLRTFHRTGKLWSDKYLFLYLLLI